ncbi:MAG: hypothetical protein AAF357_12105, partial [Verrucomicrobiota bacterium]
MKSILLISMLLLSSLSLSAHRGGHGTPLKKWTLETKNESFEADFIKYDNNEVWLSDADHRLLKFKLSDFSREDQEYILKRYEMIVAL